MFELKQVLIIKKTAMIKVIDLSKYTIILNFYSVIIMFNKLIMNSKSYHLYKEKIA